MSTKFGFLHIVLIASLLVSSCENEERAEIKDEVQQMIEKINTKCPAMIDSETQLLSVQSLPDPGIRYNFKLVKVAQATDTNALKNLLWPGLLANIKVDESLQVLRDQHFSFVYTYKDKNDQYICSLLIRPKDYETINP